ncbi:MAG: hypothetical protein HY298_27485 [Verrucomicrobia bacterium]|nr:hypothetical protein [Verrucomicrobiota bacterium]
MNVRLFQRNARWVWRWRCRQSAGQLAQTWLACHRKTVDWRTVFRESLTLMALDAQDEAHGLRLEAGAGEVTWQPRAWGTTISLRLEKFSPRKQNLVAAALGKAARYHQIEKEPCQPRPKAL